MGIFRQPSGVDFETQNKAIKIEALWANPILVAGWISCDPSLVEVIVIGIANVNMTCTTVVVSPSWVWRLPRRELKCTSRKWLQSLEPSIFAPGTHWLSLRMATKLSSPRLAEQLLLSGVAVEKVRFRRKHSKFEGYEMP
jgi:hypothetical protein